MNIELLNKPMSRLLMSTLVVMATGAQVSAYEAKNGYELLTNISEQAILDGVANGKQRKTYFSNNHYLIPEGVEVGSYYATWGVYAGRDYKPHQVPVERMSSVYIAFGGICGDNRGANQGGRAMSRACQGLHNGSDTAPYYLPNINEIEDGEANFIDDTWGLLDLGIDGPNGKYSQLQGMMDWKERNPNLKVVWSIGGWSYSRPIYDMIKTEQSRAKFINSVVDWLSEPAMGFVDGVDMDFEFPGGLGLDTDKGSPQDGADYLLLIKEMRQAFDDLEQTTGRYYELTAAIGVGPNQQDNWRASSTIGEMLPYLDRLGLMTYDFAGAWDSVVGFNSALNAPESSKQINIIGSLEKLTRDHGITPDQHHKVAIGVGFYGRSHGSVGQVAPADLPGAIANGAGEGGTVENGVFSFFDLHENYIGPEGKGINGWKVYSYPEFSGSILYNASKGQAISFTSPDDVADIVEYVKQNNFKGVFSWQIDDDNGMMLEQIHRSFGHSPGSPQGGKEVVYAPNCKSMFGKVTIKPGMTFEDGGNVYAAAGWATKCPNQGENWEQRNWELVGDTSSLLVFGAANATSGGETSEVVNSTPVAPAPEVVNSTPVAPAPEVINSTPVAPAPEVVSPEPVVPAPEVVSSEPAAPAPEVVSPEPAAPAPVANVPSNSNSTWVPGQVYATEGNEVTHNGSTWRNKWWTNGEPGIDASWENISAAAVDTATGASVWQPGKVYAEGGAKVNHNGSVWRSKWWTNGEPGVDAAWEELQSQSANASGNTTQAWKPGKVYAEKDTVVTHKGVAWRNKWWTNGEPGVDAAWVRN